LETDVEFLQIDGTMKHAHEKLELLDVRLFDSMVNVVKVSAVVDRFQVRFFRSLKF
jgi:hypothetical protein